jgi:ABC-type sugar transport system ATPase subunit
VGRKRVATFPNASRPTDIGRAEAITESLSDGLRITGLTKRYGGVVALESVDLAVRPGSVHGLIGENGAGKSTLVKILSGSVSADSGVVTWNGESLSLRSPGEAVAVGIATAHQELSLVPKWDVATNLLYGRLSGPPGTYIRRGKLREQAREMLTAFGVYDISVSQPAESLSLADRQVVEIVRAISLRPRLLLLDEPTAALPPDRVQWFFDLVRGLRAQARSVLFISHRLDEVSELCSHVTVMRDGKDVGSGPLTDFPIGKLVELMLGRPEPERESKADHEPIAAVTPDTPRRPALCSLSDFRVGSKVRGVTIDIARGEILGIAGLEGQGQLELFLGMYGAFGSKGQFTLDGRALRLRSPGHALQSGIGLVPEDRGSGLCLGLSLAENVILGNYGAVGRWGVVNARRQASLARDLVDTLSIRTGGTDAQVSSLSGGNQQKVLLGRVLARKPKLLLMYDPTRGVDVGTKADIFALVREQAKSGVTVLYYSTDLTELLQLCSRVIVMFDGKVRQELSGEEIKKETILAHAVGAASTESAPGPSLGVPELSSAPGLSSNGAEAKSQESDS